MVNDAMNPDSSTLNKKKQQNKTATCFSSRLAGSTHTSQRATLIIHTAMLQGCCFVCWVPASPPPPPPFALYLCYPVRRWCHSRGEAMIKILLSLSRRGLALRRDSLPPVQARRIVAAHLSSCLHTTGGRRVGHAPC